MLSKKAFCFHRVDGFPAFMHTAMFLYSNPSMFNIGSRECDEERYFLSTFSLTVSTVSWLNGDLHRAASVHFRMSNYDRKVLGSLFREAS